ncbi:MAG TPA: hypothetical protein VIJ78_12240 [Pseudolabrys sp.]|nr:hypothetical protein [Pseudolabrys sp.]
MAKEIRFAVGSREDVRSSVWMLWTNRDDLYLAARSTAGLSKISFHKSGVCRYAVVNNIPRPPLVKWRRPQKGDPGVSDDITSMFTIEVPAMNLKNRFRDRLPPPNKPIELIAPPDDGTKVIIRILLAKNTLTEEEVRKRGNNKLVFFHGSIPMPRETVWLISFYQDLLWSEMQYVGNLINTTKINLMPDSSKEDFGSAYMHIIDGGNSPRIIDIPLGADNLNVETK